MGLKEGIQAKCSPLRQECYNEMFCFGSELVFCVTRCLFEHCFDLQVMSTWATQMFVAGTFCISYVCLPMLHIYSMKMQILGTLQSVSLRSCI